MKFFGVGLEVPHDKDHSGMSKGEPQSHGYGLLSIADEFAGYVIDRSNVIGIHRMAQTQRIGQQP